MGPLLTGVLLLCAGLVPARASEPSARTHEYRACGAWSKVVLNDAPGPATSMVYDPVRDRMLVMSWDRQTVEQLWEFPTATNEWALLSSAAVPRFPNPYRGPHGTIVYDSVSDQLVAFTEGDELAQVWIRPLAGDYPWFLTLPSGGIGLGLHGCTPIFDPIRHRVVVIDGRYGCCTTTLALDLNAWIPTWSVLTTQGPLSRTEAAAVYDAKRNRVVLFGGKNDAGLPYGDLWQFDLSSDTWTEIPLPGPAPSARYAACAVYDSAHDAMILIGGQEYEEPLAPRYSTSAWAISFEHGVECNPLAGVGSLPPRRLYAAAYDPEAKRIVAFGGYYRTTMLRDTWLLPLGGNTLDVEIDPPAGGHLTVDPDVACPDSGTSVTLMAHAEPGYAFTHWSGGVTGTANPITFTVGMNPQVTAHFAGYAISSAVDPPGAGAVLRDPDQPRYAPGAAVTLTAVAVVGGTFSHWSGDLDGSANPITVTVDSAMEVVAHFDVGPPVITQFQPTRAGVGDVVTVYGSGFVEPITVDFNGAPSATVTAGYLQLTATVPITATNGPLHVTTIHGTATAADSFQLAVPQAAGINLSWDDCGASGAELARFSCSSGAEPARLIGSFVSPPGIRALYGLNATVYVASPSATLPDWWKHGACSGAANISATFDFAGFTSCADFYGGIASGGVAYDISAGNPAQARMRISASIPADRPRALTSGVEYYAFAVRISDSGTAGCVGCTQPMCLELRQLQLFQTLDVGHDPLIDAPSTRRYVAWQAASASCPLTAHEVAWLLGQEVQLDRVRLTWMVPGARLANIERREGNGPWRFMVIGQVGSDQRLTFEDADVRPGRTYDYRLVVGDGGAIRYEGETTVTIPLGPRFGLSKVAWSRERRAVVVSFTVPDAGAATVDLFDTAGRRLTHRQIEGMPAGTHELEVTPSFALTGGIYFVRVKYGNESARGRFAVVP